MSDGRYFQAIVDAKNTVEQDPEIMAAVQAGRSQTFQRGNTTVRVANGQIQMNTGSWWKPVLAGAGLVGGAALGLGPLMGGLTGGAAGGAAAAGGEAASGIGAADAAGMGSGGAMGTTGSGGLLGTLGSIGKFADPLRDLGTELTGAGAGLASGRRYDADANARAANFNLSAPSARASQVARGDIMAANIPQSTASGSGRDIQFSGGVGPQLFGPDTQAAGEAMKRQAMQALLSGSDRLNPSQAGAGENILAGAGLGANVLGTLGKIGKISRWF